MELKSEFDKAVTLSRILCGHSKTLGEKKKSPVQLHCGIYVNKMNSEEL